MRKKSKTFRTPCYAISLAEGKVEDKIQLLRVGKFQHPQYGELNITKEHLSAMVKNFSENVRKIDLAVDYSHNNDAEAAGWLKKVYLSDDGTELWADVDWTDEAKKCLSDKKFRYISSEFSLEYKDNESLKNFGPTLLGAGLTNRPFVKGMEPVVELSEDKGAGNMDELLKAIQEMSSKLDKLLAAESSEDNPGAGGDMAAMQAKLDEYAAKEKQAELDKKMSEKKAKFDLMLSEKKVVEAQREHFMSGDMEKFTAAAVVLKDTRISGANEGGDTLEFADKEAAQKKVVDIAMKLLSEKKAKDMGQAISMTLSDPANKALAEKYNSLLA